MCVGNAAISPTTNYSTFTNVNQFRGGIAYLKIWDVVNGERVLVRHFVPAIKTYVKNSEECPKYFTRTVDGNDTRKAGFGEYYGAIAETPTTVTYAIMHDLVNNVDYPSTGDIPFVDVATVKQAMKRLK